MEFREILAIALAAAAIIVGFIQYFMKREKPPASYSLSSERYSELNALMGDPEPILSQLRRGNKINAIKLYRQQTGAGLKESKAAIEFMQTNMHAETAPGELRSRDDMYAVNRQLLAGDKISAIKVYRQQTGASLKVAKEAVERMQAQLKHATVGEAASSRQSALDPDELQRLIRAQQKIQAIKYYRETTGVGLKEAKEAVDWLEAQMRQQT